MGIAPANDEDGPSIEVVLAALDDPDCRAILRETSQPMTATELTETCDIATSTLYRKLDLLSSATLVRELYTIDPEHGRLTRYQRDLEDMILTITDDDRFEIRIDRPKRAVDERLADMWAEMGDEL